MGQALDTAQQIAERDSNSAIEHLLDDRLDAIATEMGADVLAYVGPISDIAFDEIKYAIEGITSKRERIAIVIETGGGYIDVAERIARILRHHYGQVEFIVPSFAMSAGTVLVMSGDAIHMDYASVLGPIDPQVVRGNQFVPALGYLVQYERLIKKSKRGTLTTAEATYLIQNFDAAELYRYEQERELSVALLREWLTKYKFKNWTKTATRKRRVTDKMRRDRAGDIARKLNSTSRWHSHSRGIPMEVLRQDLKLLIDDFGENDSLNQAIHDYHQLLKDYLLRRGHDVFVTHTKGRYVGFP